MWPEGIASRLGLDRVEYTEPSFSVRRQGSEAAAVEFDFVIDDADIRPFDNNLAAFTDLALGDGVRLGAVLAMSNNICTQIQDGAPVKHVPDRAVLFSELKFLDAMSTPERCDPGRDRIGRRIHTVAYGNPL